MRTLFVVVLALMLGTSAVAAVDLVVNGGFESGSDGWMFGGGMGIQGPGAWSVPFTPNGGSWAGTISSWGGDWALPMGTANQVIFAPDGAYTLSFDYYLGAHATDPWRNTIMKVFVNGAEVFNQSQDAITGWAGDLPWRSASIPITVTGGIADILIEHHVHFAEWSWVGVDGVSLTAVPEPASLLALGAGLVGLIGIRRRK